MSIIKSMSNIYLITSGSLVSSIGAARRAHVFATIGVNPISCKNDLLITFVTLTDVNFSSNILGLAGPDGPKSLKLGGVT